MIQFAKTEQNKTTEYIPYPSYIVVTEAYRGKYTAVIPSFRYKGLLLGNDTKVSTANNECAGEGNNHLGFFPFCETFHYHMLCHIVIYSRMREGRGEVSD